jgi:hypothetical protein
MGRAGRSPSRRRTDEAEAQRLLRIAEYCSREEFKARLVIDIDKWTGVVVDAHIERI